VTLRAVCFFRQRKGAHGAERRSFCEDIPPQILPGVYRFLSPAYSAAAHSQEPYLFLLALSQHCCEGVLVAMCSHAVWSEPFRTRSESAGGVWEVWGAPYWDAAAKLRSVAPVASERATGIPSLTMRAAGGLVGGVPACLVVPSVPRPIVAPPSEAPALPCSAPNAGVLSYSKHTLLSARPRIFEGRKRCLAPRPPRRSHRTATAGENGCEHPVVDGGGCRQRTPPIQARHTPRWRRKGALDSRHAGFL